MKKISLFFIALALLFFACEKDSFSTDGRRASEGSVGTHASDGVVGAADGSAPGGGGSQAGDSTLQAGQLTAGEWNDLDNWPFWQDLMVNDTHQMYLSDWSFYDISPVRAALSYPSGSPAVDIPVSLQNGEGNVLWRTRTDNKGQAVCFTGFLGMGATNGLKLVASANGENHTLNGVDTSPSASNTLSIPSSVNIPAQADVVFVFDATGSMGDELEYIKVEFADIISRIQSENGAVVFRLGATFYRDEGDEYVTRQKDLTVNFTEVGDFIEAQSASGGGDYPEAVHSALRDAISNQQWAGSARARLVFIILDAPPHKQQAVIDAVQEEVIAAAQEGIKIIPVAASGVNKETEFLLRAMAIATNGTYTFITDHSGIGNDHLEPTIGDYEVEYLNDLIVRLIGEYVE
ncbi:MAG TPA: vWA domain-containing protein [Phaeodactylibacter sp.]|nr:vWA domain-containing protein [Phaeodactylibacter sp.]